jgi:fibronectin type 3 domain-containing protein
MLLLVVMVISTLSSRGQEVVQEPPHWLSVTVGWDETAQLGPQAQLTWTEPDPQPQGIVVALFRVYRSNNPSGPFAHIAGVHIPSTTYTDTRIKSGKTYYYQLTACTKGGASESGPSNTVAVTIP